MIFIFSPFHQRSHALWNTLLHSLQQRTHTQPEQIQACADKRFQNAIRTSNSCHCIFYCRKIHDTPLAPRPTLSDTWLINTLRNDKRRKNRVQSFPIRLWFPASTSKEYIKNKHQQHTNIFEKSELNDPFMDWMQFL